MIDIGCVTKHLHPGSVKDRIDILQDMGRRLAARITASFTLRGRRAIQFESQAGDAYQALIHNEADDAVDYLVVHQVGVHEHCFEAVNVEGEWITTYIDRDQFDSILTGVGTVLLEAVNISYSEFIVKNEGAEPEPLTEDEIDLDSFASEMSHRKIMMSHQGNMRLAF